MNVLVIKLSAFGDFIMALGAMKAIREHHSHDNITLLTTKGYAALALKTGYFNDIIVDSRPKLWNIKRFFHFIKELRSRKFDMVYDLQMNDRTGIYKKFMTSCMNTKWAGNAKRADYRYAPDNIKKMHPEEKLGNLLALAGIKLQKPDASFFQSDVMFREGVPRPFAILIPGCAPHRPQKRWSAANYGALASALLEQGIICVAVGTEFEKKEIDEIKKICPATIWFKTSFDDIAELARQAVCIVGNDTGPTHLAALGNRPCIVLYSCDSSPDSSHPIGDRVAYIRKDDINDISVGEVMEQIKNLKSLEE